MTLFGVDVSGYQGVIDWPAVRKAGITFAVAKATEGTGYVSTGWARNASAIPDAGIPVYGAYHYLRAGNGAAECRRFLSVVRAKWPDLDDKILAVDVEKDSSKSDIQAFVAEFDRQLPTHPLVLYTGGWWWEPRFGNGYGRQIGPLWSSRYISPQAVSPQVSYQSVPLAWWYPGYGGWTVASILQFTSSARVDGIDKRTDANAFRGTVADLRRLTWDSSVGIPPDTSTEGGDMAITAGGLTLTSDYVVPDVPAGTPLYDDAACVIQRTTLSKQASLRYFGIPQGGAAYTVLFSTVTGFADGKLRPVIGYVKQASVAKPVQAPVTDATPFDQAYVDAQVAQASAESAAEIQTLQDQLANLNSQLDDLIAQAVQDTKDSAHADIVISFGA